MTRSNTIEGSPATVWDKIPSIFLLGWQSLNDILNNKIVKSSAVWLIITPICAKLLSQVEVISVPFLDGPIALALPFSWVCFYFTALCFAISSLLFVMYCPRCIKDYKSLNDYKEKDYSSTHIESLFINDSPRHYPGYQSFLEISDHFYETWAIEAGVGPQMQQSKAEGIYFSFDRIVDGNWDNAFCALRVIFDRTHYLPRFIICITFHIGLIFLLLVIAQNIQFVLSHVI